MQPQPIATNEPGIHDLIIADLSPDDPLIPVLTERKAKGLETYGVPLQASNGRSHLQDAIEELADALVYIRAERLKCGDSMALMLAWNHTWQALRLLVSLRDRQ